MIDVLSLPFGSLCHVEVSCFHASESCKAIRPVFSLVNRNECLLDTLAAHVALVRDRSVIVLLRFEPKVIVLRHGTGLNSA